MDASLAPLDAIVPSSVNLLSNRSGGSPTSMDEISIPRYVFIGPKGGDDAIRLGLFAGIHGDEPEGTLALVQFLRWLDLHPGHTTGYCLWIYPVCNPTGFERASRFTADGVDLNREFWRGSRRPEVRFLEAELRAHAFHGIIALHTDDTSDGFYGYANGATLTEHLLEPALRAAEEFLPRNQKPVIDGFAARNGMIRDNFPGVLAAPPEVPLRPFEIILETPQSPPAALKQSALLAALRAILVEYRRLVAYAPNL